MVKITIHIDPAEAARRKQEKHLFISWMMHKHGLARSTANAYVRHLKNPFSKRYKLASYLRDLFIEQLDAA